MITMLIKNFLIWLLVVLPLTLLGMVILALYLPFLSREAKVLPRYLKWFDNWSGPERDGLAGYEHYSHPSQVHKRPSDMEGFCARYRWLALRNPVNYFQYSALGKWIDPLGFQPLDGSKIDLNVGDRSKEGLSYTYAAIFFMQQLMCKVKELYWVKAYTIFGRRLCIRLRVGHKLNHSDSKAYMAQWVFSFSPFHPNRS